MLPTSNDDQWKQYLKQLETDYRARVEEQANWLKAHPEVLSNPARRLETPSSKIRWKAPALLDYLKLHKRLAIITGYALCFLLLVFSIYSIFLPKTIDYSFGDSKNCSFSPLLLPGLFASSPHDTFSLKRTNLSIFGLDIFSSSICAMPSQTPQSHTVYSEKEWLNLFGLSLNKSVRVKTSSYPLAHANIAAPSSLPLLKPVQFNLSSHDATFNYEITSNGQSALCDKSYVTLSCNLTKLNLAYDTSYNLLLVRVFNNQSAGMVLSQPVHTITATSIASTSISNNSIVYSKPNQIVLTTSKNLSKVGVISLTYKNPSGSLTSVPISTSFKQNQITVDWTEVLPRQTSFDLHITNVTALDTSSLEAPYDLSFTTSGGPIVSSSNIPSYGLNSGQSMTLYFSQPLDPNQNFESLVTLEVNGQSTPASIHFSGSDALSVIPSGSYPVCATVKIVVTASLESNYDISGNASDSISSRSHCYTTYSIGTSVQGRPITAYQFGSGPSMVLFIAAMEGNERNSADLLTQWIPDIDANPGKIPSYRTVVVIPQINPDGYIANTRLNAAGTDLNRNFPANNWAEQVTEPLAGSVWTNDGGPYPLSAPEAQALATFYEVHRPRLAITEHSHGGIVEANDAGDSMALGAEYAKLADYRAIPTYEIGNFFAYTTTGAFEDWANDKLGLPVLEVELQSATYDEYSRNLSALWAMVQVSQ